MILCVILLASCKKSDTKADVPPPAKKLKYLTRATQVVGTTTIFTDYIYDAKKRLISEKTADSQTNYTYSDDKLFFMEVTIPSSNYKKTTEFNYNIDGTLATTDDKVYKSNVLGTESVYTYVVVNGRITERHFGNQITKYSYDARGNVISSDGSKTYDDKPNIRTNGFPNPSGLLVTPNNLTKSGPAIYTYTYGADGYPIGSIESGENVQTTKFAYTYTEM